MKKIASAVVLGAFVFLLGAFQMVAIDGFSPPPEKNEPFDITLNSDAPALWGDEAVNATTTNSSLSQKTLPPVLEIKVEEGVGAHVSVAQNFMRQGNIAQAIRYQRRAVEIAPLNMLYRLKLAIMYDSVSDREGAAILYRQVVEAYEKNDKTLPRNLDLENIRSRLAYLTSMAGR
ncbi:MAG: tetratricopeptide repeat protein [Bdellovibrionales bacterium]